MPQLEDIIRFLENFAPPALAEDWDNTGLLLGDCGGRAGRVMTCLTLTPDVAVEAIRENAELIVSHHPILFRAVKQLTSQTREGRMLLDLIRANIAVYSPHTAFDGAAAGINAQLAARFELQNIRPLRQLDDSDPGIGAGRMGETAEPVEFDAFLQHVLRVMRLPGCEVVEPRRTIRRVGIACGSAADFLPDAIAAGCDVFITGEARFHAALEARSEDIGLILLGHYASERFAVETLAERLSTEFPELTAWASREEQDPLNYISKGE